MSTAGSGSWTPGREVEVADRHLAWACAFAEHHDTAMTRADLDALEAVETELPNLRVASGARRHRPGSGRGPAARRGADVLLGPAGGSAWRAPSEGYGCSTPSRTPRACCAHGPGPPCAYDRFYGGDFEAATSDAERGLAEARGPPETSGPGPAAGTAQGAIAFLLKPRPGRTAMAEAITLARSCGDRWCETDALQILSFTHLIQHRTAPAQDPMLRSAEMATAEGNTFQLACHQLGLGMTAAGRGTARRGRRRRPAAGPTGRSASAIRSSSSGVAPARSRPQWASAGSPTSTGSPRPAAPAGTPVSPDHRRVRRTSADDRPHRRPAGHGRGRPVRAWPNCCAPRSSPTRACDSR